MARIPPVDPADFTPQQAQLVGAWSHLEFSRVLINSPRMYGSFVTWLRDLIAESVLPVRDRQIVCLRILELCGDVYEQTHHVVISRKCGLNDAEIADFIAGEGPNLTQDDHAVLAACAELHAEQRVSDETWSQLVQRYSREQLMELVFLAGCYQTMAMLTKSFEIALEPDLESFNALRSYAA